MGIRTPARTEGRTLVADLRRFLTETYTSTSRSFPLPFEEALSLLEETATAYDASSYNLVAVGCRSVVESACYLYFGSRWVTTGWDYRFLPRKVSGGLREVGFAELVEALDSDRLLSREDIESIKRIQTHGNFIAHYGSRLIRENEETARAEVRSPLSGASPSSSGPLRETRTGISSEEALRDLHDTARVVRILMEAAGRRKPLGPLS